MTPARLRSLATQAVELDREVAEKTERLKALKAQLVAEAKSRGEEHTRTEGGGRSWITEGSGGCVVRVTFPANRLKSSIKGEGAAIEKVRGLAGRHFPELFEQAPSYSPAQDFRRRCEELLGTRGGRALVRLCESKSSPTVSFETKEAA